MLILYRKSHIHKTPDQNKMTFWSLYNMIAIQVTASTTRIEKYTVSKNNVQGISWRYSKYRLNACYC